MNNIITIRIDANKFCSQIRRPTFRVSEDIGAWFAVLNAMGFIALLTNVAMIAFVGTQLSRGEDCECADLTVLVAALDDAQEALGDVGSALGIPSAGMQVPNSTTFDMLNSGATQIGTWFGPET